MAQEGLPHPVSESWQCSNCLEVIRSEKDCFILDCGESLCPRCLPLCVVVKPKARATCDGCCQLRLRQQRSPCLPKEISMADIFRSPSLKSQKRSPCLAKEMTNEDILHSPSLKVRRIIDGALGLFSQILVKNQLVVPDMRSVDQVFGRVISELNVLVGFPVLHLSNEIAAKCDDLEKAQTAVICGAYFLLRNRCDLAHNAAAEQSRSLLRAVSERDRVLQGLLDTVMNFRRSRRRFEGIQGVWQQESRPYPTQPTATGWAGNLTEGV